MLQERGYYELVVKGDKIRLRFCTWSIKRFCEVNGNISIGSMIELFQGGFTLSQIISMILCAAEYICIKDKKDFVYTDMDASDWIDEIGGINSPGFASIIEVAGKSLLDLGAPDKKKAGQKRN